MPQAPSETGRWYPTKDVLGKPEHLLAVFKQVLDQHYKLVDKYNALQASVQEKSGTESKPGNGPADTMLLGLRVAPIDTSTLADGTKLTYVKAAGHFEFK